jgi:pimeloyl-ACP methyl ester carboxylesterase
MGAVVSSALAVRRPELVRALMLVDPVYNIPDDLLGSLLPHIEGPAPALFAAGLFEQGFYTDSTPAFLRTWHRRRLLGTPDHVISGCLLGMYRGDDGIGRAEVAAGYLRDRRQPRLVVYVAEEAAAFERGLPRGPADEIQVWPGTGHFAHQEQSERFNRLMLTWLGRLPDAEGS